MIRLSPPPLPLPSGPSSLPTSTTSERARTRPRTANVTRVPLAPSDSLAHSRQTPSTSTARRRPNTAPSISSDHERLPIFDTSPLRPTKRAPPPLLSTSPSSPRLTLAAELSSFRMQPLADSPTSATFPSDAMCDSISPLDVPRPPVSRHEHSRDSSLSSDDEIAARNALRAGSVIANYNCLDLDFSFLDDEPPTKASASKWSTQSVTFPSRTSSEDSAEDEGKTTVRSKPVFPRECDGMRRDRA